MNNNIQESYCSLEVCMLLKEKGFLILGEEQQRLIFYGENNRITLINRSWWDKELHKNYKNEPFAQKPTHALAIEWIRVNFGIWVYVDTHQIGKWCYNYKFNRPHKSNSHLTENGKFSLEDFNSPQEATEAALLYVLNNLI